MNPRLFPLDTYPHLELNRMPQEERRRRRRPPQVPPLHPAEHGRALRLAAEHTISQFKEQSRPTGIDPTLILRVRTRNDISDDQWRRAGLTVVGSEANKLLLLFSDDAEMSRFRAMVSDYEAETTSREGQQRPSQSWVEAIDPEGIEPLGPEDRTGPQIRDLREHGGLDPEVPYRLDVELWYLGTDDLCFAKLDELRRLVEEREGRLLDQYVRDGLCMARVMIRGAYLDELLTMQSISLIDLPPRPAYSVRDVIGRTVDDLTITPPSSLDSPHICVIDSGVAAGHPLLQGAVGDVIAVPATLGDGLDTNGHGSHVAGIALYYDVLSCQRNNLFTQAFWIDSACVLNANNEFDDEKLIESLMREAITHFAARGCRIFNISIGSRMPYLDGNRPSPWAATLDNLVHELDILIVVPAGNYDIKYAQEASPLEFYRSYPAYLLHPCARIAEPATAANALTVGSIAPLGAPIPGMGYRSDSDVPPLLIAQPGQPSPFTRSGFGPRKSIKPELVDYGGSYSFDGRLNQIVHDRGLATISTNSDYASGQLFSFDHGTSFAAPRVAHLAAQILDEYPDASANLLRALLVHGAVIPPGADCLALSQEEKRRLCGYGRPELNRVLHSTDNRVVMMADSDLPLNHFHVYEVPIPEVFRDTSGTRRITVTLAFDPPVRHRRAKYVGNSMSFRLIRGLPLDEVVRRFQDIGQEEPSGPVLPRYNCNFRPRPSFRETSTVQHATWTIGQRRALDYGGAFYLVVSSQRGWQNPDNHQSYAVVVSLEHSQPIELYNAVRQRTRLPQRLRTYT